MTRAFVGVGSNIEPSENVRKALRLLTLETRVVAVSTVYETPAEGRPEQPPYYNCVVEVETQVAPVELKRGLRDLEARLGRVRCEDKYAPRTIDLDLLQYGDLAMQTDELTLPDPDIARRPYLAAGLAELAPHLAFAGSTDLLSTPGMRPLQSYSAALRREVLDDEG